MVALDPVGAQQVSCRVTASIARQFSTHNAQPQARVPRRAAAQLCKQRLLHGYAIADAAAGTVSGGSVLSEASTDGMSAWLDGLKWDAGGLVPVIAQVGSGEADNASLPRITSTT